MKSVLLLTLFFVTFSTSLPVDDPNDDVELVPIENTNGGDPELATAGAEGGDFVPVIVIRTSNSPFFGGSGGGGFGGGGFPSLFKNFFGGSASEGSGSSLFPDLKDFHDSLIPNIDPKIFLDETEDETEEEGVAAEEGEKNECDGLLCMLFKALGNRVKHIEDEIKEIQENRKNEVEEGAERQPETTYEEKILDDGTVVKINRTRYSDVSDDGSSFFGFHSTSFFSGSDEDKNKDEDMPEDKVVEATTEATAADAAEEDEPIKLVRQNNANVRK